MSISRPAPSQRILEIFFYSGVFLVFLQLLTDFVEAIYAFGLLGTDIPNEIITVLLFLSPLVLLFFPRGLPKWLIVILGEIALLCLYVCHDYQQQTNNKHIFFHNSFLFASQFF